MGDDTEPVKAAAVASLHAALVSGHGVDAALRRAFYQHPLFGLVLFASVVHRRFGPGDVRAITAVTARIRAKRLGGPLGFPAREAEALVRTALGEMTLEQELDLTRLNVEEILITLLGEVFRQWRPESDEVADLFAATEEGVAQVSATSLDLVPELGPVLEEWFQTGMHQSPFAYTDPPSVLGDDDIARDHMDQQAKLARWNREIELNPENVGLLTQRGLLLNSMGEPKQALADFDQATRLAPQDVGAVIGRGDANKLMNRNDQALADYDRALELDPVNYEAIHGRADVLLNVDRYEEALGEFSRAIDLSPSDTRIFMDLWGRGLAFKLMGRYEDALAEFSRAIGLAPDNSSTVTILEERGQTHWCAERYQEALADFDLALELDPQAARAVGGKADTYREMGRYSEALDCDDRAVALEPAEARWITGRGMTLEMMGRHDEALGDYSRAIDLDPRNSWAIQRRGRVYRQMKRYQEALADHNHALDLAQDDPESIIERGLTYQAMGRLTEAQADFARAIDHDPSLGDELAHHFSPRGAQGTPKPDPSRNANSAAGDEDMRREG